jgi:hypothetical protein
LQQTSSVKATSDNATLHAALVVKDASEAVDTAADLTRTAVTATAVAQAPSAGVGLIFRAAEALDRAEKSHKYASEKAAEASRVAAVLAAKHDVSLVADMVAGAADDTVVAVETAREGVARGADATLLLRAWATMARAAREHDLASRKAVDAKVGEERLPKVNNEPKGLGLLQEASSTRVRSEARSSSTVQLLVEQAAKIRSEARAAKHAAAEAQEAARKAESEVQRAKEREDVCHWKMPSACASSFTHKNKLYGACVQLDDEPRPWCSNDASFSGSWSECTYVCENRSSVSRRSARCSAKWEATSPVVLD